MIIGYHPVGGPTCLRKQEVGKPSQKHNPVLRHRADKLRKGWGFQVGSWNVDSLTGRAGEPVEALADREVDVECIQEMTWRGSGCRFFGAQGKRYKLFWMGGKDRSDGVGMFAAKKWVESVVKVERHIERVLILKMVLDNGLLNVLTVYAAHLRKPEEEKEHFCNELFQLVSCIPQSEMVVIAGDMNGHVGSNNVGYDGMHGGYGFGARNADGSRILDFALQMG